MAVEWWHLSILNRGLYNVSSGVKKRLAEYTNWSSREVEEVLDEEIKAELSREADALSNQALSEQIYKTMSMQVPLPPPPPNDAQVSPSTPWPRSARPDLGLNKWVWYAIGASLASFIVGLVLGNL